MEVKVKIADMAVLKNSGLLVTVGLGSCVGIALYEAKLKLGGLAHILLSTSEHLSAEKRKDMNPAKFADTAIPHLIDNMKQEGARPQNIVAKIAGGSQLFEVSQEEMRVGNRNVEAVRQKLADCSIPLVAEDVGGNYGRTMKLDVSTGEVYISTVGRELKVL